MLERDVLGRSEGRNSQLNLTLNSVLTNKLSISLKKFDQTISSTVRSLKAKASLTGIATEQRDDERPSDVFFQARKVSVN